MGTSREIILPSLDLLPDDLLLYACKTLVFDWTRHFREVQLQFDRERDLFEHNPVCNRYRKTFHLVHFTYRVRNGEQLRRIPFDQRNPRSE